MTLLYSSMKRTQPSLDLISMISVDAYDQCGSSSPTTEEGTKKRSSALQLCGWDHYKSDEDVEIFQEYQEWRNKKRSRRHACSQWTTNASSRANLPRHNGIPRIVNSEPKQSTTNQEISPYPAIIEITHDLEMM